MNFMSETHKPISLVAFENNMNFLFYFANCWFLHMVIDLCLIQF